MWPRNVNDFIEGIKTDCKRTTLGKWLVGIGIWHSFSFIMNITVGSSIGSVLVSLVCAVLMFVMSYMRALMSLIASYKEGVCPLFSLKMKQLDKNDLKCYI